MSGRAVAAALVAVTLTVAGCGAGDRDDGDDRVRPAWTELTLPVPPGAPGRLMLRDATACAGRWYVVGGVGTAAGATRPAAWTSTDGQSWTPLTFVAHSYYGPQNVLYTVACRDGRVAAVGAKSGGAHANPRVSSWHQRADGALEEVRARFELFGGPVAINVARLAAGPAGWLITGNRYSGAAVWLSPDAARFEILEDAPELSSDERGETWGADAVPVPEGWLVVGGVILKGRTDRDPLGWRSADGATWRRTPAEGAAEYDEMQRVAVLDGTAYAVGLRGRAFGAWRLAGDQWRAAGTFGAVTGPAPASVRALTGAGGQLVAVLTGGAEFEVWLSGDGGQSWRRVAGPAAMPAGAERTASALAVGGRILLLTDDAGAGRLWSAPSPLATG